VNFLELEVSQYLLYQMLQSLDLPKAIPFLCKARPNNTVSVSEIMDVLGCNLKTLSNVLPILCRAGKITMSGSSITLVSEQDQISTNLASSQDQISTEPINKPASSQDQISTEPINKPASSQHQTDELPSIVPASGRTVQHEENDIPSQACARIALEVSSLASKEVLKTITSKPQDQKQIQTPAIETKKSRVAKTEPPETPIALPSDLAALEGVCEAWGAYEMMRQKHKKHPKLSNFARNRLWNALRKFRAEQHDLVEVIAKSEGKGWTDFYRPDPPPNAATTEKPKPRADFRDNMRADVQRARLNAELGLSDDPDEASRELEDAK
jgi:hypothetical protein